MQTSGLPLHEWLALLETYSPREIDLGLERVNTMLERMSLRLPDQVFHVAGTNGKGSSAVMLEALLQRTGKQIGCYTSPHMLRYNERIRINGVEASDAQIVAAFEGIDALRGDIPLTYFEFGTLAALSVFAEAGVDIAVLEIGLGGRLDAVNAVEPTVSLITNVSRDHCAWLGEDVASIAVEKAGVMRAGKPIVFAAPDMPGTITKCAVSTGAELYVASRDYQWQVKADSWNWTGDGLTLEGLARPTLAGDIQIQNAAGVLALLESAGLDELLTNENIDAAFAGLQLEGRMQSIGDNWLFDVAHNPAAAEALAATLAARAAGRNITVILGMLDDKDVAGVVAPLKKLVNAWIAVTADSPRAIRATELARRVANETNSACGIAESIAAALDQASGISGANDLIVVTGSFYVVGAAIVALGHQDG